MNRTRWIAAGCLATGVVCGAWLARESDLPGPWPTAGAQTTAVSATPNTKPWVAPATPDDAELTADEQRNVRVYETANRSVVNIDTKSVETDMFFMQRESDGAGSGSVLDKEGHILTNYHVIDGAQKIDVTLASNHTYPATLIGGDKQQDVAVLQIEAPRDELFPISLGGSNKLRVGQRVYVMGNPFGWDGTMTTGIISSLNRNLPSRVEGREMQSLIQTDAAMNPGNSGGPLLNSGGQMIGMCVAIATRTGQNAGIGFAIPIDRIKSLVPDLLDRGHVVRADIGINFVVETNAGLVIGLMNPNGPAAQAGLQGYRVSQQRRQHGALVFNETGVDRSQADRIIALDGEPMKSGVQFRDKIEAHKPGESVTLTIVRQGRQMDVSVTLGGE